MGKKSSGLPVARRRGGEQPNAADPRLIEVLDGFRRGDFSVRMKPGGEAGRDVAEAVNQVLRLNQHLVGELERLSRKVGKDGETAHRARSLAGASGEWDTAITNINALISDLVQPSKEMARIVGAVAEGDLSQTMRMKGDGHALRGEFLRSAQVVNTMVGQLNAFVGEVTRVAREVGTEGKLGGQAQVLDVGGVWKDLTENVNSMAGNLTNQVRNIAAVPTAVAKG
ncbi:MAG: hybrid sensor histidine kinase/response regulator, partial [Terriglobales bacterium]